MQVHLFKPNKSEFYKELNTGTGNVVTFLGFFSVRLCYCIKKHYFIKLFMYVILEFADLSTASICLTTSLTLLYDAPLML